MGAVNGLDRGHGHMNKGAGAQRTFRLTLLTGRQRGLPRVSCYVGKSGKNVRFTTTVVLNL